MAKLEKLGARKPRIPNGGTAFVGCMYSDEEHERGDMPPMEYRLTVCENGGPSYTSTLTEDEMLHAVGEWMKLFAGHRAAERKRDAKSRRS